MLVGNLNVGQREDAAADVLNDHSSGLAAVIHSVLQNTVVHIGGGADGLLGAVDLIGNGAAVAHLDAKLNIGYAGGRDALIVGVGILVDGHIEGHSLAGHQIQLVVGAVVDVVADAVVLILAVNEDSSLHELIICGEGDLAGFGINGDTLGGNHVVAQLFIDGPAFVVLDVGIVGIFAFISGIVDTNCIQVQIIAAGGGSMVEEIVVAGGDLDGVLAVVQTKDLDDGHLVHSVGIIYGDNPFAGIILGIAIEGIHDGALNGVAIRIGDLDGDGAGSVAGHADHIEAGAPEGEVGFTTDRGSDGDLGGRAHGVIAPGGISAVVTILIVGIVAAADRVLTGTVGSLGAGLGTLLPLRGGVLYVVGEGLQRQEVILIVDRGSGDDGNLGVHTCAGRGGCAGLIVVHLCLIEEGYRSIELHAVSLIQRDADIVVIDQRCSTDGQSKGGSIAGSIGTTVDDYATGSVAGQTHNTGCHGVILYDVDHHIQAEVHDDGVLLQLEFPDNSEGNGSVGEVEALFNLRSIRLAHDGVDIAVFIHIVDVIADDGAIGGTAACCRNLVDSDLRLTGNRSIVCGGDGMHSQATGIHAGSVGSALNLAALTEVSSGSRAILSIVGNIGAHDVVLGTIRLGVEDVSSLGIGPSIINGVIIGYVAADNEVVIQVNGFFVFVNMDGVGSIIIIQSVDIADQLIGQILGLQAGGLLQIVPDDSIGVNVGDIHSLSEGNHTACAVDGLAGLIDQVEHVGNLCAVPGHLRNREFLLNFVALEVGVGQSGVLVGVVGTRRDGFLIVAQAGGVIQVSKVL